MIKRDALKNHQNVKYRSWNGQYVLSGMKQDFNGLPAYSKKLLSYSKSRHLTAVFNLFVFFQIFNMICCRKINDEINIFSGIFENVYFGVVWIMIVILQVLLITFAGRVFKCHAKGLTPVQWAWTVLPGLFTFLINVSLKCESLDKMCPIIGSEDPKDVEAAQKEYSRLKRNVSSIRGSQQFVHNKK